MLATPMVAMMANTLLPPCVFDSGSYKMKDRSVIAVRTQNNILTARWTGSHHDALMNFSPW